MGGRVSLVFDQRPYWLHRRGRWTAIPLPPVTMTCRPGRSMPPLLADYETGLPSTPRRGPASGPAGRVWLWRVLANPNSSSGGGPFGTFVRGGGALLFGDILGERKLGVAVQVGNRLRDAAFQLRFLNQERRWTWGAIAELDPGIARSPDFVRSRSTQRPRRHSCAKPNTSSACR